MSVKLEYVQLTDKNNNIINDPIIYDSNIIIEFMEKYFENVNTKICPKKMNVSTL